MIRLQMFLLAAGGMFAAGAHADVSSPYLPMAFLAGHCWKGALPAQGKSKQTDEHCFAWIYDGRFLRDRHVVRDEAGHTTYQGETTYYWDASEKTIGYIYIEDQGGHSLGSVQPETDALDFPATDLVDNGHTQTYRTRWQRAGEDAYDVVTEFKTKDGWTKAWAVHMQKATPTPGS
jgi:hypothetical protein